MSAPSATDMEVDEQEDLNKNIHQIETPNTNTNTNKSIPSESKNNNNSMEIDSEHTTYTNKENNPTSIPSIPSTTTTNNAPKRRKKRKRDEMEIDLTHTKNNKNNKNTHNNHNNSSNAIKRRKVTKSATNKTPKKKPIITQPMPQKWQDKYKQYKNIIISNYKLLINETTTNKLLFKSTELQSEIQTFKSKTTNNNNINFNDYITLICALSYGRNETLTDLLISIKNILNISSECAINIREIILKSMHRKLYGIKPISKSINKNEEKIITNDVWHKCRIYEWECLNINNIDCKYRMDNKKKKSLSLIMTKYGTFCKKYDVLCRNNKLNTAEKSRELQKIEDGIISWQGKEEALRRKKELKEKELLAKKEKREKELAEKKEKKEKKEKELAEKKEKKKKELAEKKEKKKKEKAEKLKKEKLRKEKLEKERLEKKEKENKNLKQKTPKNIKKRKSFIDNWAKTSAKKKSLSMSLSPLSRYKKLFIPAKYPSNTIIAPIFCKQNGHNLIDVCMDRIIIHKNAQKYKNMVAATAIPAVFVDQNVEIDNMVSRMQIDTENDDNLVDNRMKLQWKYRDFSEDNRPCFFGVNKKNLAQNNRVNVARLGRSPFARIVRPNEQYSEDDSGVEWYEDIDDLDQCSDYDEDEEALMLEIENYEKNGLIREDGFENDKFILNESDDDDCDVANDKDIMKNIKKTKLLKNKLKDEYPIKFEGERQRGDEFDKPIMVNLLSFNKERNILYQLILKKTFVFDEDEIANRMHIENENDIKYLLQIENKDEENKNNEEEKKKKKKKKKDKEKKKKKEKEKKIESMKMECDEDEDDDIKMSNRNNENNNDKSKISKQNTLNHYFIKTTKNNIIKGKNNSKDVEKKKKRRVVMCELVE